MCWVVFFNLVFLDDIQHLRKNHDISILLGSTPTKWRVPTPCDRFPMGFPAKETSIFFQDFSAMSITGGYLLKSHEIPWHTLEITMKSSEETPLLNPPSPDFRPEKLLHVVLPTQTWTGSMEMLRNSMGLLLIMEITNKLLNGYEVSHILMELSIFKTQWF